MGPTSDALHLVPPAAATYAPATWWRHDEEEGQATVAIASTAPRAGRTAFAALVAFTVILLLSPQIWFPVLGQLRIAFLAAGLAIGAHLLQRGSRQHAAAPFMAEIAIAAGLVCWAVVTIPVSYWPTGSFNVLTNQYMKAVAFFWLIGTLTSTASRVKILAWTLVLCSIPLAATGIHHYMSGKFLWTGVPGLQRIYGYDGGSGLVGNPNDLALMLNLTIPIAAALMLSASSAASRCLAGAAVLLNAVAVVVTFSRGGFLALAAIFVMVLLKLASRAPGKAILLLLATLAVLPFLPNGYVDRLATITNVSADRTGSALGRWNDYQIALGVVARNPIIGVGLGQDILAMNQSRGDDEWISVHNVFLQYAVDLGVPGLFLFLWLYLKCFRSARAVERRARREPAVRDLASLAGGVQISLVAFGVAGFFHPIAYQFYFFTIAGLAVALKHASLTALAPSPVGGPGIR